MEIIKKMNTFDENGDFSYSYKRLDIKMMIVVMRVAAIAHFHP